MQKFHINNEGNPGVCHAESGGCPFGDAEAHYNSKEEAHDAYEKKMGGSTISVIRKIAIDKKVKKIPSNFHEKYDGAIWAERQYNKINPGKQVETAEEAGMMVIVVPNVKRLTDKKRLEVAEAIYHKAGFDPKSWDGASDESRLRYAKKYVHRYNDVEIENKNDEYIYFHLDSRRRSGSRSPDEIFLMD